MKHPLFTRSRTSYAQKAGFEDIDSAQAKALLEKDPDVVLLDVRTAPEFHAGHLEHARHFDIYAPDFVEQLQTLDRSKTYLVYCRSGNRSAQACEVMNRMGFTRLHNLAGGILEWNGTITPSARYENAAYHPARRKASVG